MEKAKRGGEQARRRKGPTAEENEERIGGRQRERGPTAEGNEERRRGGEEERRRQGERGLTGHSSPSLLISIGKLSRA